MSDDVPTKKKVNGKNKGNGFERKIAQTLSARFATLTGKEMSFRRNADSGSFFGGGNFVRTQQYDTEYATFGDLICPRNFLYSVECKHYKTPPTFQSLLLSDVKLWDKWIAQAEQDSNQASKKMMLVIKYNNVSEFVLVNHCEPTLMSPFAYKGKFAYTLSDYLTLDDSVFFS